MGDNRLLFVFVMIIVVLSFVNIVVSLVKIGDSEDVTGYASGYVNLSISRAISLNLSRALLDWGPGIINGSGIDSYNATLYTNGDSNGIVLRGNWSGSNVRGLILQNIGTVPCSIKLQSLKDAHDFFSSVSTSNEEYKWNVSNKEPGSCISGFNLGEWSEVNKTSGGTKVCDSFDFNPLSNELYIDILITVPYDSSFVGTISDTIVIQGDVAG